MMTKEQAIEMLDQSPCGESPARVNPAFTQKQAVETIRAMINVLPDGSKIEGLREKRVWQVYKNQRRPRF